MANEDLIEKAADKPTIIQLTSDIKLLNDYCKAEASKYYQILKSNPRDKKAYTGLQNCCYVLTLTLNRKRVGELQRVLLKHYTQANTNIITPEFLVNLSDVENITYKAFKRVMIRGKRHVTVPLLIARLTQKYLEFLLKIRSNFIPTNNQFLFALSNEEQCVNGSAVMRTFTQKCRAKYPKSLRSTKLRKHITTISQVYHLNEEEVEQLCSFMGHTKTTHKEFYRYLLELCYLRLELRKINYLIYLNK